MKKEHKNWFTTISTFGFWDRIRILLWGGLKHTVTLVSENDIGHHDASGKFDWIGRPPKKRKFTVGNCRVEEGVFFVDVGLAIPDGMKEESYGKNIDRLPSGS